MPRRPASSSSPPSLLCTTGAASAAGRPDVGAGRERDDPSRRPGRHGRRAVHGELRVLRRRERATWARRRTARARARRPTRRLHLRSRCRSARRSTSPAPSQPGHARLQLVADDAEPGRDRPGHLRVQRPRARAHRPGRRRKVNPSIPFWGGPTGIDRRRHRRRRQGPELRQLGAARRDRGAEPEGGREPRRRRQRLVAHRLHRHAGASPATPGSAFSIAAGQALGVLSTVALAPARGQQRRRRPHAASSPISRAHELRRHAWRTAPSPSGARSAGDGRRADVASPGAEASGRRGLR
jgi:hypothetical protein